MKAERENMYAQGDLMILNNIEWLVAHYVCCTSTYSLSTNKFAEAIIMHRFSFTIRLHCTVYQVVTSTAESFEPTLPAEGFVEVKLFDT